MLLLFLLPTSLRAADRYAVASGGVASGTCPTGTRCTLAYALTQLAAADRLILASGTYTTAIDSTSIPSGSDNNNHTIVQSESGDRTAVIIRPTTANNRNDVISITNNYITIRNLTVDAGGLTSGDNNVGISQVGASQYVLLSNLIIRNCRGACVGSRDEAMGDDKNHLTVSNSTIGPCDVAVPSTGVHCIYLRSRDNTISSNYIFGDVTGYAIRGDVPASGIAPSNWVVSGNTIYDNASRGINFNAGSGHLIFNNILYDNDRAADSGAGILINGGVVKAYNNTIVGTKGYCIWFITGAASEAKNNICYQNTMNSIQDDTGSATLLTNFTADPAFVNGATHNYHLLVTSGARNTGTTLADVPSDFDGISRPQESVYDIGAFEYQPTGAPALATRSVFGTRVIR